MKERIFKALDEAGIPLYKLILRAISETIADDLKHLAEMFPNDQELGCEIRKLINE
jgi:hypothetical protein